MAEQGRIAAMWCAPKNCAKLAQSEDLDDVPGRTLAMDAPATTYSDERLYAEALSRGVDYGQRREGTEDLWLPVELLATAVELAPALALVAPVVAYDCPDDYDERREAAKVARGVSAGLVRVAHWAREVHARDVGYKTQAWIVQTIALTTHLVEELNPDRTRLLEYLQEANAHLACAFVALQCDRLAVADCITQAQAAWLATYACSRAALDIPQRRSL
jgi:hypothetical protein